MRPFFLVFLLPGACFLKGQNDSTKALFNNVKYSYIQWDLGYTNIAFKGGDLNGIDACFLGAVFNENYFVAFGTSVALIRTQTGVFTPPHKVDNYIMLYLNTEYLIRPRKLINFSFPVKWCYAGAAGYDTIPPAQSVSMFYNNQIWYYHQDQFFVISPGFNVFINVFRSLSIGAGGNYKFAFGVNNNIGTNADYSNYTINAFIRLKFDTKAYTKKMIQRQRELFGVPAPK